jgi:hypothetical protein
MFWHSMKCSISTKCSMGALPGVGEGDSHAPSANAMLCKIDHPAPCSRQFSRGRQARPRAGANARISSPSHPMHPCRKPNRNHQEHRQRNRKPHLTRTHPRSSKMMSAQNHHAPVRRRRNENGWPRMGTPGMRGARGSWGSPGSWPNGWCFPPRGQN